MPTQSAGQAWLFARQSPRLFADLPGIGGDAGRIAVGLRGVCRQPSRLDNAGRDRDENGGKVRSQPTNLGDGSWHHEREESGVFASAGRLVHRRNAQSAVTTLRSADRGKDRVARGGKWSGSE